MVSSGALQRLANSTSQAASWGGRVLAFGFGDGWQARVVLGGAHAVRGPARASRHGWQIGGLAAHDVEPRGLLGAVAPVELLDA